MENRRGFLGNLCAVVLAWLGVGRIVNANGSGPRMDYMPKELLFRNGKYVGRIVDQTELWLWPYADESSHDGWRGMLEDKENRCWGFVDREYRVWRLDRDGHGFARCPLVDTGRKLSWVVLHSV